ncbi:aldehyde dehydrogenase (NADP(+)) [Paraglaciecola sp.]|uniref:aldehyde dehydrogenase (NADP(+)) n=1 Tax=Paraglaciecola sp. TaxID=1920173 RepID=UPI003EF8802D
MNINGEMLIGNQRLSGSNSAIYATNPATGEQIEPAFNGSSKKDVIEACKLAESIFDTFRNIALEQRANFLECIADEILALGDTLVQRAMAESGLPQMRIEGERGRTMGQLKLFASVVRVGNWVDARIDPALPNRTPLPRSDIRLRHIPLGPVAIFGASNFPLAFSVAGGDTASALAAGCPVVVKAHSAHPGTSELVGKAIIKAANKCNMPEGVFSLLFASSNEIGTELVAHPAIKAVGFTGSRAGGLALMNIAANRPEPIPVYAEMSSINPVFLLPNALKKNATSLATGFVGSLTLGAGQFCTNPGLVIGLASDALDQFIIQTQSDVTNAPAQTMLTEGIHKAYTSGTNQLETNQHVSSVANGIQSDEPNRCQAKIFKATAESFLADPGLTDEVFGSTSLVISCQSEQEMLSVAEHLEGQLTATMQLDDEDTELAHKLLPILERKAGRVLCNGYPTGVEVCHAMVHGGPFPATSDSRTTSVGSAAILRYLRPVSYQDMPAALLPNELRDDNELGLNRLFDGKY